MKFAKSNLKHAQFFLAERVFSTLQIEDKRSNILDIEKRLSLFADRIVIVLESPSSFTELGVFAHGDLRDRLIIINDSKFRNSKSFIAMGPLRAIEAASDPRSIIYYKMNDDGVHRPDAIGDVFSSLSDILEKPKRKRFRAISKEACNPGENFDKKSAMMMHDLVLFSGPITYAELVEVLKLVFGNQNFNDAKELLAILVAIDSLALTKEGCYQSKLRRPYYDYRVDINSLVAVYRNYMHKYCPERLYEH